MHRKLRRHPDTGKREAHFRSLGDAPGVEQFARFAFGDVEMGPLWHAERGVRLLLCFRS